MLLGCRLAITIWLLYNMWQGRPWALYTAISLMALSQEVAGVIIGKLIRRTDVLFRTLRDLTANSDV